MTFAMATSDKPLQPKLLTALTLVASGSDWDSAADAVGMTSNTLRRHFNHDPRATAFVERVVRENLNTANNVLANAAPRLADELVQIALDRKNKAYARTAAIGECFRIKVLGEGDYLPSYAGNLDIINCAAIGVAEDLATNVSEFTS